MRVVGLMSGTSLDGIDAALVEFEDGAEGEAAPEWSMVGFRDTPYTPDQRALIHEAILDGGAAELCELNAALGEWFADAVLEVCDAAGYGPDEVDLVGSHGQTVWHEPGWSGGRCATLQLGSAAVIAERTGIPVVSDFRARDVAAGGEGAPLVAWTDRLLYSAAGRRRALQNLGGMANVTWLPERGAESPVLAFDTGPGMAMIDAVIALATGGRETYDHDGRWAARGNVDDRLLAELLEHPYFAVEPPKSTGRETFGRPRVEALVERRAPAGPDDWADLAATVTALTARSIGNAYRRWVVPRGLDEVVLTGGGAHNPVLRRMIEEELATVPVRTGEEAGIESSAKEAIAFAALAWAFERRLPGNVPEATGAAGPRVLGSYTPGSAGREKGHG